MKRKLRKILRNIDYKNKIVLDLGTGPGSIKGLSDLCDNTTLVGLSDKHSFVESQKQMVKSKFLSKNTLKTSGVSPRMKAYQLKAGNTNTSREVKKEFEWLRKIYWGSDFWSSGFFLRQLALMKK